jgi:YD repeat-containing protein
MRKTWIIPMLLAVFMPNLFAQTLRLADSATSAAVALSIAPSDKIRLATDGDPIDLYSGLYMRTNTDLAVQDTLSIGVQRTYRNADSRSRSFGIGTSHLYDMFIVGDAVRFTYVKLVLPDGAPMRYERISPGTGYANGVFEHTSTPTIFYGSRIFWNGTGWTVSLRDGSSYKLLGCSPGSTRPGQCGLIEYRSSRGEVIGVERAANGDITRVVSPHGKWIEFTYDQNDRVTSAAASTGEMARYGYDAKGRLTNVTPSEGPAFRYEYDDGDRMINIFEGDQVIHNFYDHDLCIRQPWSRGKSRAKFSFKYVLDSQNQHVETDVTEPDGTLRKVVFNENGYVVSDTRHSGRRDEASLVYMRDSETNNIRGITVACGTKHAVLPATETIAPLQAGESEGDYDQLLDLCTKATSAKQR